MGVVVAAGTSQEVSSPLQRGLCAKLGNLNFTFCPAANGWITGGFKQWKDVNRIALFPFCVVTTHSSLVEAGSALLYSAVEVWRLLFNRSLTQVSLLCHSEESYCLLSKVIK